MAKDHFKKHYYQKDRVDWNFNILVGQQPDVQRMAQEYAPVIQGIDGLYDPIPTEWLHMTVLRVGLTDEYTEEEMLKVADVLAPKLAVLQLPELVFDGWWQWGGSIVFNISPDYQVTPVYDAVIAALEEVVGADRATKTPHGRFVPHVSFAYSKDRDNEIASSEAISNFKIAPAKFRAPSLALIRQWPADGHYKWEIVRELAIGQNA